MGATKTLFELMAQQEVQTNNFLPTKKEIELNARKFASNLIEAGEIDKYEAFTQAVRLSNAIEIVKDEIKSHLPKEKHIAFGVSIEPRNGGEILNYNEDWLYSELQEKLKQRAELIKVSTNSNTPVFDENGIEVTKVSKKIIKDSLVVKY